MINFPTNVHPHNNTIVMEKRLQSNDIYYHMDYFTFTFTGGFSLGYVEMNLFNMDTEEQLLSRVRCYTQIGDNYSKAYSGDTIEISNTHYISSVCDNGFNYAYNLILFQYDFNDMPIYDMFLFKGSITTVLTNTTQIQLEKGITNLYENFAIIKIGTESRLITAYNSITGIATIESAFTNTLTVGQKFNVYCNYVKSQNYFFKARNLPTITPTITREYGQVGVSIDYVHPQNTPLKSWQYSLWQSDNLSKWINGRTPSDYTGYEDLIDTRHYYIGTGYTDIVNKTICFDGSMSITDDTTYVTPETSEGYMNNSIIAYNADTGIITLGVVSSSFPISKYIPNPNTRFTIKDSVIPFVKKSKKYFTNKTNYRFPIDASGHNYHLKYSIITQDDVNIVGETDITFEQATESLINNVTSIYMQSDTNSVALEWDKTDEWEYHCPVLVFRKDEDDNVYTIVGIATHSDSCFIDYTVGNTKSYEYMLMPCRVIGNDMNYYYKTVYSQPIDINFFGWTITAITDITHLQNTQFNQYKTVLQDDIKIFGVGDTWKLEGEVQDTAISQNLNKSLQIGLAQYPTVIRNGNNYLSGTFNGLLGYVNCETDEWHDDIYLVEKWRKFMADNTQFLLRSSKGDVWCVEVSHSSAPTTTYDEKSHQTLTTISFDFVEFENVDNLLFVKIDNDAGQGTIYEEA